MRPGLERPQPPRKLLPLTLLFPHNNERGLEQVGRLFGERLPHLTDPQPHTMRAPLSVWLCKVLFVIRELPVAVNRSGVGVASRFPRALLGHPGAWNHEVSSFGLPSGY